MLVLDGGKKRRFDAVAFDPTGRLLAACGDYQPVVVWEVPGGAERGRLEPSTSGDRLLFHPRTGRLVLPGYADLRVWDPAGGGTVVKLRVGPLAFAPGGGWVVYEHLPPAAPPELAAAPDLGVDPLWAVPFGDAPGESGHTRAVVCLPDGQHLASAEYVSGSYRSSRSRIAVRRRADGRLVRASPAGVFGYGDRLFGSPACDYLVVHDGIWLRIHPAADLSAPPRVVKNTSRKHFTDVAFHPGGRFVAAASNDETVKLLDVATGELATTLTWAAGRMRSVCFSPDGTLAAAGSDAGTVVVWDVDL